MFINKDAQIMGDRTLFVPPHVGDNVLPNIHLFHKLLRYSRRSPAPVAVRDLNAGIERTYQHMLSDVLAVRNALRKNLSTRARQSLDEDKEVYIGLMAPGGYEYTVGFIAILATGAAVVPMGKYLPHIQFTMANLKKPQHCPFMKLHTSYCEHNVCL